LQGFFRDKNKLIMYKLKIKVNSMKKLMFFAVFCLTALCVVTFFSCSAQTPQANLKTDMDSLSYAYGVQVTQGLDQYLEQMGIKGAAKDEFFKSFLEATKIDKKDSATIARITAQSEGQKIGMQVVQRMLPGINEQVFGEDSTQSLNKAQFLAGFLAAAQNQKLLMKKDDVQMYVQAKTAAVQAKVNEPIKAKNQAYLDKNKTAPGVVTTASGLQYKVVKEGAGVKPALGDTVLVNYALTDVDGKKIQNHDSIPFVVGNVIPGWNEGVQMMSPGSKYTFYIPYNLAYGEQGQRPNIGPFATLIFDVDLLKVSPKKAGSMPAAAPHPQIQIAPHK
jgi:FKBP-type peptidyl-prolyl cis-trans isomerase FklB